MALILAGNEEKGGFDYTWNQGAKTLLVNNNLVVSLIESNLLKWDDEATNRKISASSSQHW